MLRVLALLASAATVAVAYDETVAQQFAYLSSIAYCPVDKLSSWTCGK